MAPTKQSTEIEVPALEQGRVTVRIIGTTPLFLNKMSAKAKQQLLIGGRKKTAADKKHIKHHPYDEFREAAEYAADGPTALAIKTTAIKGAMTDAALETAGITKTSAQRLLLLPDEKTSLYGAPFIRLDVTRSADINRTPDIRSRPFLPKWGAEIDIIFVRPTLTVQAVITLLCNAGALIGVGDFRQQKGRGNFGLFRVIGEDESDPEWDELVATGGKAAQLAALKDPQPANDETAELLLHYDAEAEKRAV